MNKNYHIKLKYVFNSSRSVELLLSIGFLLLSVFLLTIVKQPDLIMILIISFLCFLSLTPVFLLFNYSRHEFGQTVFFDFEKEKIKIQRNYQSEIYDFNKIEWVELYKFSKIGLIDFDYNYCKYFFKNGDVLILSCLSNSTGYFIPDSIKPNFIFKLFPFINNSKTRLNLRLTDMDKLTSEYEKLDNEALNNILKSIGYRKEAKEAAQKILKKRMKNNNIA